MLDDNLLAPHSIRDPQAFFRRLREQDPVYWSARHKVWIVTSYQDVQALFQDPSVSAGRMIRSFRERLTAKHGGLIKHAMGLLDGWMLLNDPPAHTRLRDPVRRSFSPTVVKKLVPRIELHANTLLDRVGNDCEFVGDFARPLTALVICDLLGVDIDQQDFLTNWSREFGKLIYGTSSRDGNYINAVADMGDQFHHRFAAQIEARRRQPSGDLLSLLVTASESEQWTETELIGACSMLLFAGHDTTSALLTSGISALLMNPDQLDLLRQEPALMPSAVEELLRFDGPSKTNIRVASQPMSLGGHEIEEAQHLWLGVMAANHDPSVFEKPAQLDIQRNPNPHLAFGAGIHFCLGPSLARMEARVAFNCLLERYSNISLTNHIQEWSPTIVDRSLLSLPLVLAS